MRARKPAGGGGRRRSPGDGEPDLFAEQLAGVVQQAFAEASAAGAETPAVPAAVEDRGDGPPRELPNEPGVALMAAPFPAETLEEAVVPEVRPAVEVLPARMLNEFVYCPRLFYYEHVEGVFVESADTVRGKTLHKKVDRGTGAMPEAPAPATGAGGSADEAGGSATEEDLAAAPGSAEAEAQEEKRAREKRGDIHSKSVWLGSERLGVTAKMDLVEVTLDAQGGAAAVCPVDYKVGAPRVVEEGLELWDADRMQLGLQCLVLRENGYSCEEGIIFYRATKQRVPLALTPELEAWIGERIGAARRCAAGPRPAPLVDSPKCVRCSLASVCLPDETRMLTVPTVEYFGPLAERTRPLDSSRVSARSPAPAPRRLIAPRDEKRALYLNTPGYRVGCHDEVLKVKDKERLVEEVRLSDLCHVALFGNIQLSTQAVQRLCDAEIPVTYFSMGGWFYGITRGHGLRNVLLRIEQFRHAADPGQCLRLAQQFVRGKIHNHRVLFMRNHAAPPERTKLRLGQAREDVLGAQSLEELLGMEGAAAHEYFAHFGGLLREQADDDFLEGLSVAAPTNAETAARFTFDFSTRNRRPPTDAVNALLSLAYSLLAKELFVGLGPTEGRGERVISALGKPYTKLDAPCYIV